VTRIPTDEDVVRYARSMKCNPAQVLPRATVREVPCPECHAQPGSNCRGVSGIRESNHLARCFERIRLLLMQRATA
jgi:hypothetical protein